MSTESCLLLTTFVFEVCNIARQVNLYLQASPFFDKLVFSKIKARLGGHVRLIVTGGAPLANHVEEFLKVCFCCPVVQGYGLTETCAASCIAVPDKIVSKPCISPQPGCLMACICVAPHRPVRIMPRTPIELALDPMPHPVLLFLTG